jgi:hypothetical protein
LTYHLLIRQHKVNLGDSARPTTQKKHMAGDRPATDADRAKYAGAIDCDLHPALPGMSDMMALAKKLYP